MLKLLALTASWLKNIWNGGVDLKLAVCLNSDIFKEEQLLSANSWVLLTATIIFSNQWIEKWLIHSVFAMGSYVTFAVSNICELT